MAEAQRVGANISPKARLVQDAPPASGWVGWDTRRRLPGRGPPGIAIFAGVAAYCVWGLWRIAQSHNRQAYVHSERERIFFCTAHPLLSFPPPVFTKKAV